MTDIEKQINSLSNMKQYKKCSVSELEKIAKQIVYKKQINIKARFKNIEDQKEAEKIFDHYIQNYNFETFVDYKKLADLVYEEILLNHLKDRIDKVNSDDSNGYINDKEIKSLHETQEKIYFLQEQLGITKSDKKDDLTALQMLQKKFEVYIPFNRNEFTAWVPFLCSNCGHFDVQGRLFRRRVKEFDCLVHPGFSGRYLYNYEIIDDVKDGKITKEQAARYLRTSPRYIEWAIDNEHKIIDINGVEEQRIIDFVNANPNLRDYGYYNKK